MPRIAVVVLDALRKDAFDRHFGWLPGLRYDRAYSTSHYTVPAHASLFTGRYPSETGTHARSHVFDPSHPPLAEALSSGGFETRAFTANVQLSRRFGWDRGFDRFDGSWKVRHANATDVFDWNPFIRQHRDDGPTRYLRALWACLTEDCATIRSLKHGAEIKYHTRFATDDGAAEARDLIAGTTFPEDAFLFLNLMEAHAPYRPPPEYRSATPDDFPGFVETMREAVETGEAVRTAYDDAVGYLSDVYREIFAELSGAFDYVITLADHGEMLGENGVWGHGFGLYPELTRIPLVVWGTGTDGTRQDVASLLDVHRTILDLAGVDGESRGRNLLAAPGDHAFLTEYLGLNWFRRQALEEVGKTDVVAKYDRELYGVAMSEDYYGYETFDGFVETGTQTVDDPRGRMEELVESLIVASTRDGRDLDPSEGMREHLSDLGYL